MNKRAVLYARVSTDEQAEKGYSLPSQLEALRRYAVANGFEIVAELAEDYTGTTPIEIRPEGRKAYEILKSGKADTLIAYTIDRLVRPPEEGDEWDMPILIRGLAKLGKDIHTVNRGKLEVSFSGLLLAMLDAKSSGDERRKLIERTTRGRAAKARSGKVVGTGRTLYGYTYEDGGYEIVESEANIIRRIYEWYVRGDGDGKPMSGNAIARRLTDLKVPTPGEGKGSKYCPRKRGPGLWGMPTIHRILKNEAYMGIWRYGKMLGHCGKGGARTSDEQITVSIPSIVDTELWKTAQGQRKYNQLMSKRNNTKRAYLLRGRCRCGECNGRLAGGCPNQRNIYYSCCQSRKAYKDLEPTCKQKSIPAILLDAAVWDYVTSIWSDKEAFENALRQAQKFEEAAIQPQQARLQVITEMMAETERESEEIALALKKARGLVSRSLERQMIETEERYKALCSERDEVKQAMDKDSLTDEQIDAAMQFREDVMAGMQNPTFEDKRRILQLLQVEATVKDWHLQITCRIPKMTQCIDLHITNDSKNQQAVTEFTHIEVITRDH